MISNFRMMMIAAAAAVLSFALTTAAGAVTYGFTTITSNNALDVAIGEAQLSMEVTDAGAGQVSFEFSNSGPEASSVEAIYWEAGDPAILGDVATVIDVDNGGDVGVDFEQDTSVNNLPGGNTVAFLEAFDVDANAPAPTWGINPGEMLTVIFDLVAGFSFADVIAQLNSGDLRVGMHVIAFESGGSESFINEVPIPASFTLLLAGIGAFGAFRLKARKAA